MSPETSFYVGYLPMPRSLRRTMTHVVSTLVAIGIGSAALVAGMQRDPGDGVWDLEHVHTLSGVVTLSPYPQLLLDDGKTLLLVSDGKRGAMEQLAGADGKRATLRGHELRRGDLRLLELLPDNALTIERGQASPERTASNLETATLRGEIIDPKCFSGAMKPGTGKTHKACAILCLRGGIQPMFLAEDGSRYLLTDANGHGLEGDALESVLPFVADRVEVTGALVRVGEIIELRLHLPSIRRL